MTRIALAERQPAAAPARGPLFWNEEGRVSCTVHAPWKGSDSWIFERWQRMSMLVLRAYAAEVGRPAECEVCGLQSDADR